LIVYIIYKPWWSRVTPESVLEIEERRNRCVTLLFLAIALRILLTDRFLFQLPEFSSRLRIFLANEAIDLRCVARGSPLEAGE
jgi:hypothetical protein